MATITVTNLNNDGEGSLRAAIDQAAAQAGADEIVFAQALSGQTIRLSSRLMLSSGEIAINGDTDSDGDADITISGDANGDGALNAGDLSPEFPPADRRVLRLH